MEIAFLALRILLAVALYSFLGLTLWLIWMQLRLQAAKAVMPAFPELVLTADQVDRKVFRFNRSEVIIGRQPGCDLRLQDGTISARHTRLFYRQGQWWVEDLHSRNGTYLNDERLKAAIVVADGDGLRCGGVKFEITIQT